MNLRLLLPAALLAGLICPSPLAAADEPAIAPAPPPAALPLEQSPSVFQRLRAWSDERLRALYENIIVDAQNLHKFGARPQPHFGDLLHSDYTRLDLRYFYGFADKLEGEATFDNYFPTPKRGASGVGFSQVTSAVRYRWVPGLDPTGKATSGFEFAYPIHGTPDNFTDGVNRYTVFASYARTSTRIPNFQEFFNLSYTVITPSGAVGSIDANLPQDDYLSASIGWLRNAGRVTYGFTIGNEYEVDGDAHTNFFTLTPTVMVTMPGRWFFGAPGEFQVGTSVACKRYRNINEYELRIRVRWYVKVKELLHGWRHQQKSSG